MKNYIYSSIIALILACTPTLKAQVADDILGNWLNQEGTAKIHVFKAINGKFKGKYFGKIYWLKEPTKNGKPKVDEKNPDASKRNVEINGLILLNNFEFDADDKEWEDGTIYDPKNGKTYSCNITMDGDKLNVRGYVGISMIGRTAIWTKTN
jgi:uncharacterized protein (DUF2147 family)